MGCTVFIFVAGEIMLQKGNIVRLKSGGPSMTVLISDEKTTRCFWFTILGELKESTFNADMFEECGSIDFLRTLRAFLDRCEIRINTWR